MTNTYEDIKRYEQAVSLQKLSSSRETAQYLPAALELFIKNMNGKTEGLEGLIKGASASRQGIEETIKTYTQKYEQALGELTFEQYCQYNEQYLEGIDHKKIAGDNLNTDMKTITGKMKELAHKRQSPKEEEKISAEKEIREYEGIQNIIDIINDYNFSKFIPEVYEETAKKRKELYKKAA